MRMTVMCDVAFILLLKIVEFRKTVGKFIQE
jgi:hypothetical protein